MNRFSKYVTNEKPFHDYKFVIGDTNYRIDMDNRVIREHVRNKDYQTLIAND